MGIATKTLETLDDAKRLIDLVYSTYGLTYHRSFIYEPERMLEMGEAGSIRSLIAVDEGTGRVVGHLATIRPHFEIACPLPPGEGPAVVEVGLSIVHPDYRAKAVQGALAVATVMETAARNPNLRGFYMKCLTEHTWSQRSARRFLGGATALFLGGVPAWVICDEGERRVRQPKTTVLIHCPYGERVERPVFVPASHEATLRSLFASAGLSRKLQPVQEAAPPSEATELRDWFDPARRQGLVRVKRAGEDLVDAVAQRVDWLARGHMEHITVLLPLSTPGVAAAVPELEARGLFFGGVIPDMEGVDTLVLESLSAKVLDPDRIEVLGEEGELLKQSVMAGWRTTGGQALKEAG